MLVPLAAAGLALIHQGLGRSRSAAHAMLATLCALGISAIVFVLLRILVGGICRRRRAFVYRRRRALGLAGRGAVLPQRPRPRSQRILPGSAKALTLCLEMFAAGLAAMIPLSGGTDRWRLAPICLASAVLAGFIFPLFAHWVWGAGWLAQLSANFGIPGFVDAGGAGRDPGSGRPDGGFGRLDPRPAEGQVR